MENLKVSYTLTHSFVNAKVFEYVTTGQCRALFLGFEGTVPQNWQSLPFDASDIYEMYNQAQTALTFELEDVTDTGSFVGTQSRTYISTKQHYQDTDLNKWSLAPSIILEEDCWKDFVNKNNENLHTSIAFEYRLSKIAFGMRLYWNPYKTRDIGKGAPVYENNNDAEGRSYDFQTPLEKANTPKPFVMQFDNEVTVDSLEYKVPNTTDARYSPVSVDVEVWDSTLNDGQGDWSSKQSISLQSSSQTQAPQYFELDTPLVGTAFRFEFHESSLDARISYIRCLSSVTPSDISAQKDITWGLILPYGRRHFQDLDLLSRDTYFSREDYNRQVLNSSSKITDSLYSMQMPMLLVDTSGPEGQGSVVLTKAQGVKPEDVPEMLDFSLDFSDM